MNSVVVITTGGTIASTTDAHGAKVATIPGDELLAMARTADDVAVSVVDLASINSYAMTLSDMDQVRDAVGTALSESSACGVVVTHGTDTLEETAMLVDLFHDDPRPVVFTGAQRSWDDPDSDGPRNLHDAITVAASPSSRNLGVVICFAGAIHAARGTRKVHTSALGAFSDVDHGPIGTIADESVRVHHGPVRGETGWLPPVSVGGVRVDTVALYPGADRVAIDALIAAGAHGLVLQATGYGNANRGIVEAVRDHTHAGIPIVLSTRVPAGPVRAVYGGGGGGVDLTAAGAMSAGLLRPSQARILLAALLAAGVDHTELSRAFHAHAQR